MYYGKPSFHSLFSWNNTVLGFKVTTLDQMQSWGVVENEADVLLGAIVAGTEAGFSIPPAGGDKEWLKENMDAFRRKAEGDEDFRDMVEEVEERGLV